MCVILTGLCVRVFYFAVSLLLLTGSLKFFPFFLWFQVCVCVWIVFHLNPSSSRDLALVSIVKWDFSIAMMKQWATDMTWATVCRTFNVISGVKFEDIEKKRLSRSHILWVFIAKNWSQGSKCSHRSFSSLFIFPVFGFLSIALVSPSFYWSKSKFYFICSMHRLSTNRRCSTRKPHTWSYAAHAPYRCGYGSARRRY